MTTIDRILRRLVAYQLGAVASAVAEAHRLPLRLILSRVQTRRVAAARHELLATVYQLPGWSYRMVAELFERDASSVCAAVDRHLNRANQHRAA